MPPQRSDSLSEISLAVAAISLGSRPAYGLSKKWASAPLLQDIEKVTQSPRSNALAMQSVYKRLLAKPPGELASLTLQRQRQWIESVKKAAPFLKDPLDFILSYAKELKQEVFEDLATLVLNTTDNTADLVLIDRLADLTDWQRELLTNK